MRAAEFVAFKNPTQVSLLAPALGRRIPNCRRSCLVVYCTMPRRSAETFSRGTGRLPSPKFYGPGIPIHPSFARRSLTFWGARSARRSARHSSRAASKRRRIFPCVGRRLYCVAAQRALGCRVFALLFLVGCFCDNCYLRPVLIFSLPVSLSMPVRRCVLSC